MPRRSLKPQLNQIRGWVRQGRTDAWIAHQLEASVRDIREFKREHALVPGEAPEGAEEVLSPGTVEEQPDLRAEDDALIAAELDAEPDEAEAVPTADDDGSQDADEAGTRRRRRGRRGGRGRRRGGRSGGGALEGTFDHGEDGYGLWLDPAVQDDPVYAEHWAGHRPVTVSVEADRIVIERAGEGEAPDFDEDPATDDALPGEDGGREAAVQPSATDSVTSGGGESPSEP
jgi:hypothetical protein